MKDVAELLLESVLRRAGESVGTVSVVRRSVSSEAVASEPVRFGGGGCWVAPAVVEMPEVAAPAVVRKKWAPKAAVASVAPVVERCESEVGAGEPGMCGGCGGGGRWGASSGAEEVGAEAERQASRGWWVDCKPLI